MIRRVWLFLSLGKIWAKVAKRPERSFQVYTAEAVCSVRGTMFSVESLDQGRAPRSPTRG